MHPHHRIPLQDGSAHKLGRLELESVTVSRSDRLRLSLWFAAIDSITRKMMATVSELSMYQATAIKLNTERQYLSEEISEAKTSTRRIRSVLRGYRVPLSTTECHEPCCLALSSGVPACSCAILAVVHCIGVDHCTGGAGRTADGPRAANGYSAFALRCHRCRD